MTRAVKLAPKAKKSEKDIVVKLCTCPKCGNPGRKHSIGRRRILDIGQDGPAEILVKYGKYYCKKCQRHFNQSMDSMAPKGSSYTNQVHSQAISLLSEGKTFFEAAKIMKDQHFVNVSSTTLFDWKKLEDKKNARVRFHAPKSS